MSDRRLKIGVSACFFHAEERPIFTGKTLQYIEQSMAHWIMTAGAMPVMIPNVAGGDVTFADYADWLDGLVLEGGADLWPGSYRETPIDPRWKGDQVRDEYEIELVRAFEAERKPILGVCRGVQLINVAFGGTLYQDIATQKPQSITHRDQKLYDRNFHHLAVEEGSHLAALIGTQKHKINSVHHQAIKDVASEFVVEARCAEDGIIEAIRRPHGSFIAGVQWHPEFHRRAEGTLDDSPILRDFLEAARGNQ